MQRTSKNYYSLSTAPHGSTTISGVWAGIITFVYAFFVLSVAVTLSYRAYQWARWSVVQSYPLTAVLPFQRSERTTVGDSAATVDRATTVQVDTANTSQPAVVLPPINILLLGTDERPAENEPARTDTIIVLSLDTATSTAGMLSLPRDLWVNIPGYNFSAKINTAYTLGERDEAGGGPQLTMDTVSTFIGHPIDYYVRINFQGFVEVVDLIGGVDIFVAKTIHDEAYPTNDGGIQTFHLDAGLQHLDGETALKYARTRNVDDDYGRARRQQDVIRAVVDKVLRTDMIAKLLPSAWKLLLTMRSSIDTNIPFPVLLELATYMRQAVVQDIRQEVLDSRFGEEQINDDTGWILIPDREKVRTVVNRFFTPSVVVDPTADPEWVRIEILNGTDQAGVAARTRDYLQAQGWHVVAIGDADRDDYNQTILINYGVPQPIVDKMGETLALSASLSSLKGLNSAHPVDLRIVVGRDLLTKLP